MEAFNFSFVSPRPTGRWPIIGGVGMRKIFIPSIIFLSCFALATIGRSFAQTGGEKSHASADFQSAEQNKTEKDKSIAGFLHTRDKIITIRHGADGPLYTIKTKNGKTLATNIGEKDLQAKYPDIYRNVKEGRAANDARLYPSKSPEIRTVK
jgi:hypothetical protein